MKSTFSFLKSWSDTESIQRLKKSHKSKDVQIVETENYLKQMSLRFERYPRPETLQLWAKDIIESGFEDWMVGEVCKSIPYKFERHPTLNQIMELLRPYLPHLKHEEDELDNLTRLCLPLIKKQFLKIATEETLNRMINWYLDEILPGCTMDVEASVLFDWLRAYQPQAPIKVIEQGKKSNEAWEKNDKEYFIRPLRNFAKDNLLL